MKNNRTYRSLISLSDKTNLDALCKRLINKDIEIISTGGTYEFIKKKLNYPVTPVSDITQFPEILDGRVKTLHPSIFGGILALRNQNTHLKQLEEHNIDFIDMVFVNLYPFEKISKDKDASLTEIIEQIDIGGPSLIRATAKNFFNTLIITDPDDYELFFQELENSKDGKMTSLEFRRKMATKAFRRCAEYDTCIADYFNVQLDNNFFPEKLSVVYDKKQDLRYGENPHQRAAFYSSDDSLAFSIANSKQLYGKELSYNNIQDANVALEIMSECSQPSVVAVKHLNPCGYGTGRDIFTAWKNAYSADSVSIFGGIVALNKKVDEKTAKQLSKIFLEIVLAPSFSKIALELLSQKKNLRILEYQNKAKAESNTRLLNTVRGGVLIQTPQKISNSTRRWECVTEKQPTKSQLSNLSIAWKLVKHVKSNAIVLYSNNQTIGIGAGQMNRVGAVKIAIEQAGQKANKSVLASDAFFPLPDSVELAAKHGIKAIIQPGGSIKDGLSIKACNKYGIAMIFTKERCFKH